MNRSPLTLAFAATLFAALAATGCKRDADTAATAPAATEPGTPTENAPDPAMSLPGADGATGVAVVTVSRVEIGNAVGGDNRVTGSASTFRPADTVYVSVETDAPANTPLTARWTYQDGQVVNTESKTLTAAGPTVTEFHISKPGGWPTGNYRVEILSGDRVLQSREFSVQ
ncbi:MAG TPA: hypothetical protein VIG68_08085 [Lysobacter sp.]